VISYANKVTTDGANHNAKRVGMIVYDFTLSASQESHTSLAPFELFRESLVIIGIGDAKEYQISSEVSNGEIEEWRRKQFLDLANLLHDQFPRVLLQRVLLFDDPNAEQEVMINDEFVALPYSEDTIDDTLRRIVHDMTLSLRRELSTYSKSIQSLPSISSPTIPQFQTIQPHYHGLDSPTLNRPGSYSNDRSPSPADHKASHRMTMPAYSSNNSSETILHAESPGPRKFPAKTFEEMTVAEPTSLNNSHVDRLRPRPVSVISSRTNSQERVSVHGFGSDSFSEKTRNKGLGRIGVVQSGLFLIAGRWEDALRESIESAIKARSFSDHLWYAKSLEHVAISMVLMAWSGMEFQVSP